MFSRKNSGKSGSIVPVKKDVHPDLLQERKKCTFNTRELTYFLDGGVDKYRERKEKEEFFLSDPELIDDKQMEMMSHEEQYRESLRKSNRLIHKLKEREKKVGVENFRQRLGLALATAIFKDGNPMSLHNVMFIPTIEGQGTPGQVAHWVSRASKNEILGTYAQTELGHGTFLRGLETTATYLPETEQFELNSPTLTSYKWWPGGLGHTSGYAVVMAQLYTRGKCHGIHAFIVQLRDERTYRPMPGIKIGEIGRKLGMNATNNGFLAFDKVHIPRSHMLMKNAQVEPDGTYVKSSSNSKLVYGSMIFVRVILVEDAIVYINKVCTIGVRYSAVRRQSEMRPGEREPQILDYQTQQYKLIPFIAFSYAFRFAAAWLWDIYHKTTSSMKQGNLQMLPELHAMACCLKSVCTSDTANAVETVRLACGGHGYMTCSNLPTTYGLVTAMCTYEGENTVMLLQTARALIKSWGKAQAGEALSTTMAYLMPGGVESQPWNCSLERLALGFKQIAAAKVNACGRMLQRSTSSGLSPEDAWNQTSVQLVKAAEAHCRAFLVERYVEAVRTGMNSLSPELRAVMLQLCELYTVYWTLLRSGDFLLYAGLQEDGVSELVTWQARLLAELRPNAVGLVDSFDLPDEVVGSALGSYDGQVYEHLLESALKSPLNSRPVHDSFNKSIAPLLKAKY